jgi:heterodisulfide reductase subunit A
VNAVRITLDGVPMEVELGTTILAAATSAGVTIPTLCHYGGLEPAGACRICVVELKTERGSRLVPACHYAIEAPADISTSSERVVSSRKMTIELLLARCPEVPALQELAAEYGVETTRLPSDDDDCILCGLCVRTCRDLMDTEALSMVGRGHGRRVAPPYDKKSLVCMSCGACAFVCPTNKIKIADLYAGRTSENLSTYDERLVPVGNIRLNYSQQIPKVPVIDRENCVHFVTGACGACEKICNVGAIDYDQEDREETLNVGAVIVTPGYDSYDASQKGALGYGRYENVLTNLQFERILSASGPCEGEIRRPSDGAHPRKVAFLQCVGSRDTNEEGKPYCSSICCMASIKEAVIAREHDSNVEPTIFYIDMRTQGKEFERYFEGARNDHGIVFKRSSVAKLYEKPATKNLVVRHVDEETGEIAEEEFDLVVLAAGLVAHESNAGLAESLNITLNEHGFCEGHTYQVPGSGGGNGGGNGDGTAGQGAGATAGSAAGIFTGGAFTEPRYIPEAVVEGSCAASGAARLLAEARGTLARKKKYPKQLDVAKAVPRIGVFICRCGINIAGTVNVPDVVAYSATLGNVVHASEFVYSCSQDSLEVIKETVAEHKLNRVVVASCTPRTHEYLFADTIREAGLNRYYFELASIREHCSWVHMQEPELATQKAKELVEMMVSKVRGARPVSLEYSPVVHRGLVIGGGVSGMNAALSLAEQGYEVDLVEKEGKLGGNYLKHRRPVWNLYSPTYLEDLEAAVRANSNVTLHLNSEVILFSGVVGNFYAEVCNRETGEEHEISCGAAVVATGAVEREPVEYGYGTDERIMTQLEFESLLGGEDEPAPDIKSVAMIQCVGSREEPNLYCSRICCTQAIQNAMELKRRNPDATVHIIYRDIRTYGVREELYREAREAGVLFLRYDVDRKPEVTTGPDGLKLKVYDRISRREVELGPDAVVLSTGLAPRPDSEELSKVLRVPLTRDGFFLEAHAKIRPVDFTSEGLFLAGLAHSPRFTNECVTQSLGASARAATILSKDKVESKAEIVEVNLARCSGCALCVGMCPYEARQLDPESGKATVNDILCQGCGACAGICPNKATVQHLYRQTQIMHMLEPVGAQAGTEAEASE